MNALGFDQYTASYLAKVIEVGGTIPQPQLTPWVLAKFTSDIFKTFLQKVIAVYPFIGATKDSHALNLFGLGTRFTMVVTGNGGDAGLTHSVNGTVSNNSANFNMGAVIDMIPNQNQYTFGFYSRTSSSVDAIYDFGNNTGTNKISIAARSVAGNASCYGGSATAIVGSVGASSGLFTGRRHSSTTILLYRNASAVVSSSNNQVGGIPNGSLGILGVPGATAGTRQMCFGFITPSSVDPTLDLYTIVQALQTHFGRQV